MYHITFQQTGENIPYKMAVVLPYTALREKDVKEHYCDPYGLDPKTVLFIGIPTPSTGKEMPSKDAQTAVDNIFSCCSMMGIDTIYFCEGSMFKKAAGVRKVTGHLGLPIKPKDNKFNFSLIYGINYQRLFYDPTLISDLNFSFKIAIAVSEGKEFEVIPEDLTSKVKIIVDVFDIKETLNKLLLEPVLALDIEAFSLKFYQAGLASFCLSPSKKLAYSFPCDLYEDNGENFRENNYVVRSLLKNFLINYKGKMRYHNMSYDAKVLIYVLFMEERLENFNALLEGLDVLTKDLNFDDTKLITYLATNSTAGNELSLKKQAHEFAGNYGLGEDIKDVLKVNFNNLLTYNGIDGLSTNYVYEKHWDTLVNDKQLEIYETIFKKSVKLFLQAELVGIPICLEQVAIAEQTLITERDKQLKILYANPAVQAYIPILQQKKVDAHNAKLKTKKVDASIYDHVTYNPSSDQQTVELLITIGGLEYEDKTDGGAPSVSKESLIKIKNLNKNNTLYVEIIDVLIELSQIDILLSNFIEAFKNNSVERKGMGYFLFGSFNIGGTVSGRLSSSKPNLQNLPSKGNKWAYLIKACFKAPKGWLFVGADFASLEDKISALQTKDPQKLKTYIDGYDGHCLRAFSYFSENMPDINDTVDSINSIKKLYPDERQDSKEPTFLLTYGGTWRGLVTNAGFTEDKAKLIEERYHTLYRVSDEWKDQQLQQACKDGYVTCAFGLRVRTPILSQTVLNTKKTPWEAQSEARTAGNALGQSYCMLNNRAGIEVQEKTLESEYRLDIWPTCHIHDAQYFLVRNKVDQIHWLNDVLTTAMLWQDLEEIYHPDVKLGGELSVFYPSWNNEVNIPVGATKEEIISIAKGAKND